MILVTDYGFLSELDHVWETLVDIDGGGDFLDAHFRWTSHSESQRKSEEASKDSRDTVAEHTENASVDEHDPNRQIIEYVVCFTRACRLQKLHDIPSCNTVQP